MPTSVVFVTDSNGDPLRGLTPTWHVYRDVQTGNPKAEPAITELASTGLYMFQSDDGASGIIDAGATATPRYYEVVVSGLWFTFAVFDSSSAPKTSAAPAWECLVKTSDGSNVSQPAISELGGGLYKIDMTSALQSAPIAGIIDQDPAAGGNVDRRYRGYTSDNTTVPGGFGSTTTSTQIITNYVTAIEALTPPTPPEISGRTNVLFRRSPPDRLIEVWANKSSEVFRRFSIRPGAAEETPLLSMRANGRAEEMIVTVAYPVLAAAYGRDGLYDQEEVMRADARLLRDTIHSPGNYVTGQNAAFVTLSEIDRDDPDVWFLRLVVDVRYWESESL